MNKYLMLLVLLTGCGIKHTIAGGLTATVDVNHKIDLGSLNQYFKDGCRVKLIKDGNPAPTQAEIETCTADAMFEFLAALKAAT